MHLYYFKLNLGKHTKIVFLRVSLNVLDCPMFMTSSYIFKTFLGLNPGSLNLSCDVQVKTNRAIIYRLFILYVCNLFMCKKARNRDEEHSLKLYV